MGFQRHLLIKNGKLCRGRRRRKRKEEGKGGGRRREKEEGGESKSTQRATAGFSAQFLLCLFLFESQDLSGGD